jgi:hypothetical protein
MKTPKITNYNQIVLKKGDPQNNKLQPNRTKKGDLKKQNTTKLQLKRRPPPPPQKKKKKKKTTTTKHEPNVASNFI